MASMVAKRRGRQENPTGGKINLTIEERAAFKAQREKRGHTHRTLGAKAGVSGGTISNIETGASGQVNAAKYAAAYAVLFGNKPEPESQAVLKKIIQDLVNVDPDRWPGIADVVASIKKLKDQS